MNIGIDLDGVVFDTERTLRSLTTFINYQNYKNDLVDNDELRAYRRFNWTKEQDQEFLKEYLIKVQKNAHCLPFAKEVMAELKKSGHKLFVITNRGKTLEEEIKTTQKKLKKEKLSFEKVVFSAIDKLKFCKELKIDIMIDDYYDNVDNLSKNGIKCLYLRELVAKKCENENVTEVQNWADIYYEIKKLENR
jgi:uncharacterized HAD superfamily protein